MAFFCSTMLSMALELASEDPDYEDVASKFFEHFVAITDAMNTLGGTGLWDEEDGFYYDQLLMNGQTHPAARPVDGRHHPAVRLRRARGRGRSTGCPGFKKRMQWFLEHRKDLAQHISFNETSDDTDHVHRHHLLAIPSKERLVRVLSYMLDENEFLSPYGVRSLCKVHEKQPYVLSCDGQEYRVDYVPGESDTYMFGGNSNWRGPIWFPVNYLLVEVLERYHHFYGDTLKVECPTGSGRKLNLKEVSQELRKRLISLFLPDDERPPPVPRRRQAVLGRPDWRGPGPVLRILPRRQRPRRRREPPDGLDGRGRRPAAPHRARSPPASRRSRRTSRPRRRSVRQQADRAAGRPKGVNAVGAMRHPPSPGIRGEGRVSVTRVTPHRSISPPCRFLVTAGNTRERIDRVRDWGNIFTGNTGCGSPARWPTSATSTCSRATARTSPSCAETLGRRITALPVHRPRRAARRLAALMARQRVRRRLHDRRRRRLPAGADVRGRPARDGRWTTAPSGGSSATCRPAR